MHPSKLWPDRIAVRVIVTGAGGQLARDLIHAFRDWEIVALTRRQLDIADTERVEAMIADLAPDVMVNTAAYHQVDRCESEPEASFLVNAAAPQRLAAACKRHGVVLIHYSTDYVFDGEQQTPYREEDPVHPLSVYGASKAAGEMAIRATSGRHLIIRTTGLYGQGGRSTGRGNFVETMLRVGATGQPVTVVSDQVLTPTATSDVATVTRALIVAEARGTFHVTNSGSCSWYDFAAEIFRQSGLSADLHPTTQRERPLPARRPAYSVLAHDAILALGVPELRPWQEALGAYLRERGHSF